jgi:hypothetical protein
MNELVSYVCDRMPVRSRLIGRAKIAAVVEEAVRHWPGPMLVMLNHDGQERLLDGVRERLSQDKRFGSILLLWGIALIVQLVWQWWLSRSANQMQLADWQREMRGDG